MNKLSNYLLLFFISAGFLFLASCGEDGEPIIGETGSTITGFQVSGTDTDTLEVERNQSVTVSVGYDLDDNTTGVTLRSLIGDSVLQELPISSTSPNPIQTNFTVPSDAEGEITVEYQLRSEDETVLAREDFIIVVDIRTEAEVYRTILLDAPLGDRSSETFFSATSGEAYTLQEVIDETDDITSDSIHFGYYYLTSTGASIASPAEYRDDIYDLGSDGANWGTLNETLFRKVSNLSAEGFDGIVLSDDVADQFETQADASTESGTITQLAVDEVYAFSFTEGDETRFGVFRVDEINAGDGEDDSITLTVKVARD